MPEDRETYMGELVQRKLMQRKLIRTLAIIPLLAALAAAQKANPPAAPAVSTEDYSGMYTFLREGEFVQITVEDAGHVTGFISRYGETDSDQGAFLTQFFKKKGKLDAHNL